MKAKLEALKAKLNGIKAGIGEKLDKITFIQKWRERRGQASAAVPSGNPDPSLGHIYREGGVGTRLHIIIIYALVLGGLVVAGNVGMKAMKHFKKAPIEEDTGHDMAHGLEQMSQRVVDNARLVSLGNFVSTLSNGSTKKNLMATDIWIRVSDPEAADFAQKNDTVLRDVVINALNEISQDSIDPLSDEGKLTLKSKLLEAINKAFPKGRAEEIFFQNLVVQ